MTTGAGNYPVGSLHCGFGQPSQINSSTAKVWIKRDGTQGNASLIDPRTGDYVLDEFGNSVGDDSINQMVFLALTTIRNTSAVSNFGLELDINNSIINESTLPRVKLAVFKALKHLTDPQVITIVDVTTTRISGTGLEINVQWQNNSTGEINIFTF